MPNRILKDSICTSQNVDALSVNAEVFFYRLIVQCDDYGRMDARLSVLRARCYPLRLDTVTDAVMGNLLQELVRNGLITLYEVGGQPYLEMVTWHKHQQVRAQRSKYPQMIAQDINCNQLQSIAPVIQSNPIQSESNPNPIVMRAASITDNDSTDEDKEKPTPTKKTRTATEPTAQQAMFQALAEVTLLDAKLKAKQLGKTASELIRAEYTPAHVQRFGEWWATFDWRGQKGAAPTLAQVVELIKQANTPRAHANGNGKNGSSLTAEDWDGYAKSLPLDNFGKYDDEPVTF